MDTLFLAWAAGFMDGEGTFTIKRVKRGKWRFYQAYITCGQVDKPTNVLAIERLKTMFGGSLSRYIQKPKDNKWLNTISWACVSNDALSCARQLLPYLVIKKRHCELLIEFCEKMDKTKRGMKGMTTEERLKREYYWEELRKLNTKGKLRLQRLSEVTPENGDAIV